MDVPSGRCRLEVGGPGEGSVDAWWAAAHFRRVNAHSDTEAQKGQYAMWSMDSDRVGLRALSCLTRPGAQQSVLPAALAEMKLGAMDAGGCLVQCRAPRSARLVVRSLREASPSKTDDKRSLKYDVRPLIGCNPGTQGGLQSEGAVSSVTGSLGDHAAWDGVVSPRPIVRSQESWSSWPQK
jgi:hypothetical protein